MVMPRTPPGVLELLPPQQLVFQRMLDTIRRGFERFGFLPIETPVFELTEVLLTKSGGETEKQVYFVQSTGSLGKEGTPELAMRFDLTVPLARYVAEHEAHLSFPFRRYQIQRVYRGERAQKGRYREFYQCDIDVIGRDQLPLAYDAELPAVIYGIFSELAIGRFTIYINNRKLLRGLLEGLGIAGERQLAVLHEVDRLAKQSRADVEAKLVEVGLTAAVATQLLDLLAAHAGDSRAILESLRGFAAATDLFREGLAELAAVYEGTLALGVPAKFIQINPAIVRGLDYYTGTIYETFLDELPQLGSICSGGRYADLAGLYTKSKLPGVGISIGATRLYSRLLELAKQTEGAAIPHVSDVLVAALEPELALAANAMAAELRAAGWNVEVYTDDHKKKIERAGKYLDRAGIPFAILYGTRDRDAGVVSVRDRRSGTATVHTLPRAELVAGLKAL